MEKSTKRQDEMLRKAAILRNHAEKRLSVGDYALADAMNGKARAILRKVYRARDINWNNGGY